MGRLWGRDGSRWTSISRHWGDIQEYQKHKDDPELGQGIIGTTKPTKKQRDDLAAREAKKPQTPMHEDARYSS